MDLKPLNRILRFQLDNKTNILNLFSVMKNMYISNKTKILNIQNIDVLTFDAKEIIYIIKIRYMLKNYKKLNNDIKNMENLFEYIN